MDAIADVKKALKEKSVVIGADLTLKLLRQGKVKQVFFATNVKESVREDITHYTSLSNVPIVQLVITNNELGTLCKKPFSISVISVTV